MGILWSGNSSHLTFSPSTVYHCAQTMRKCFSPCSHGHREHLFHNTDCELIHLYCGKEYRHNHTESKLWLVMHFSCCGFSDKVIRHRACSLKDTAHAIFAAELDPEFDRMCEEIKEARKKRGKKIHWKDVFSCHLLNMCARSNVSLISICINSQGYMCCFF